MYIAVRCPLCLVTVYTILVENRTNGTTFSVMSLADEDLPFYNCPMPLCGYHIPTFHLVNLYLNPTIKRLRHSISMGFNVSARTIDTRPFRSPSQVASLAITLDPVKDELQRPPVATRQVADKPKPTEEQPDEEQPDEEQPAEEAADTQKVAPSGQKWTDAEVEKLVSLNSKGLAQMQIANEMGRSILSVRYKLGTIRDKERLDKRKMQLDGQDTTAGI